MITPDQVIVKKFNPDWNQYETRIDAALRKDWYEGEERQVNVLPALTGRSTVHPVVVEMVKRYQAVGWKCESYGYTSMTFFAPKMSDTSKDSSPGKKRWWLW